MYIRLTNLMELNKYIEKSRFIGLPLLKVKIDKKKINKFFQYANNNKGNIELWNNISKIDNSLTDYIKKLIYRYNEILDCNSLFVKYISINNKKKYYTDENDVIFLIEEENDFGLIINGIDFIEYLDKMNENNVYIVYSTILT